MPSRCHARPVVIRVHLLTLFSGGLQWIFPTSPTMPTGVAHVPLLLPLPGVPMFISIVPEPTPTHEAPKRDMRRKAEKVPRTRVFDPLAQRWFQLSTERLPFPERLELMAYQVKYLVSVWRKV